MSAVAAARPRHKRGLLHPYQVRINRDLGQFRVIKKSRRIGVTYSVLGQAVLDAIRGKRSTYYMSHNHLAGREAMTQVGRWADYYDRYFALRAGGTIWRDGSRRNALSATAAHFASGKKLQILASTPENLRGPPDAGHYILDEFALHRRPAEVLQAAAPVQMLGSPITIISTVMFEDHFWDLFEKVRLGEQPGSVHAISFDDALADGLYERVVRMHTKHGGPSEGIDGVDDADLARELGVPHKPGARARYRDWVWRAVALPETELGMQPMRSGDRYYSPRLVRACMDDDGAVHRWTAPEGFVHVEDRQQDIVVAAFMESIGHDLERLRRNPPREWYFGIDFGRYRDLTVIQFGYPDGTVMRWPFILELEDAPLRVQDLFFDGICDRVDRIRQGAIDKSGGGVSLYEHVLRKLGPRRVLAVDPSEAWYRENQPLLKRRYEQRTIRTPRDELHVADMATVRLDNGVAKVPRGSHKMPSTGTGKARFRHGDFASSNVIGNFAARDATRPPPTGGGGRPGNRVERAGRRAAQRM